MKALSRAVLGNQLLCQCTVCMIVQSTLLSQSAESARMNELSREIGSLGRDQSVSQEVCSEHTLFYKLQILAHTSHCNLNIP